MYKMMIAGLALLTGCSVQFFEDGPLVIDYQGTHVEEAHAAAEEWNTACGKTMIVFSQDGVTMRDVDAIGLVVGLPKRPAGTSVMGVTALTSSGETSFIEVDTAHSASVQQVMAHEFWHALSGSTAHRADGSLMELVDIDVIYHTARPEDCRVSELRFSGK